MLQNPPRPTLDGIDAVQVALGGFGLDTAVVASDFGQGAHDAIDAVIAVLTPLAAEAIHQLFAMGRSARDVGVDERLHVGVLGDIGPDAALARVAEEFLLLDVGFGELVDVGADALDDALAVDLVVPEPQHVGVLAVPDDRGLQTVRADELVQNGFDGRVEETDFRGASVETHENLLLGLVDFRGRVGVDEADVPALQVLVGAAATVDFEPSAERVRNVRENRREVSEVEGLEVLGQDGSRFEMRIAAVLLDEPQVDLTGRDGLEHPVDDVLAEVGGAGAPEGLRHLHEFQHLVESDTGNRRFRLQRVASRHRRHVDDESVLAPAEVGHGNHAVGIAAPHGFELFESARESFRRNRFLNVDHLSLLSLNRDTTDLQLRLYHDSGKLSR